MNSKQRVQVVFKREIADRVPIGEYCFDSDTVERVIGHETYLRAKARAKIALWEGRWDEVAQSWKEDILDFYRRMPVFDIVNLGADVTAMLPPKDTPRVRYTKLDDTTYETEEGDIYKYSEPTRDLVQVKRGKQLDVKIEDFRQEPHFTPPDPTCFHVYDAVVGALKDDFFIIGQAGPEVGLAQLGTTEETMLAYAMEPELMEAIAWYNVKAANWADTYHKREGVDAIIWGQDHAYRSGPMVSPEMFRRFALPVYRSRVESVKKELGTYIVKHACGNNWKILDIYVECGFDAYQSIQASAGMDLGEVKRAYGDKLVLWGGLPLELLQDGTMHEVREATRKAMAIGKPGGGYIFGSTHSIATGTKYDNFMAMLEAYEKSAAY